MAWKAPRRLNVTIMRDDDRDSARDGIRVDGQWNHKRVCEGERRCRSVGTCVFSVQGPHLVIDAATVAGGGR